MVSMTALHSMLIEMHGGMLTLAALSILAVVIERLHRKMRKSYKSYGVAWPLDSFLGTLSQYAEPTAYLAGIGGVVGLIVSAVVGFYVWPLETLTNSSLGLTKVMFSIFAMELWIMFIVIRSKFGKDLWENRGTATVYALTGFAGFFFTVLTGSFGGHMAGKGSVLDSIYELLGVNPEAFWIVRSDMVPVLIAIAFIEILALLAVFLRYRRLGSSK